MSRILFAYDNLVSAAATTVTASTAATSLPAAAAQNPDRSYPWRSTTSNTASGSSPYTHSTLDIDLGSVQACSLLAVANPVVLTGGAIRLYERGDGSSPGSATLVATLPAMDAQSRVAFVTFTQQSHRHWRLEWTNPSGATGYAEAGYVYLGVPLEPSVNWIVPADGEIVDPSIATASVDGQTTITTRTAFTAQTLTLESVSEDDFDDLRTMYAAVGVRRNFFVVLDSTRAWTCQLIRFVSPLKYRWQEVDSLFTVSLDYEEAR